MDNFYRRTQPRSENLSGPRDAPKRRLSILATTAGLALLILLQPAPVAPAEGPAAISTLTPRAYLPLALRTTAPHEAVVVFEFSEAVSTPEDPRPRAVAFHDLRFIDANASALGTLAFGTPEAGALQGEGWYANENCPDVGACQWAGGTDRRATIRLTLPSATDGLLLSISGIRNGIWMTVTVDGVQAAVLRVDEYWHSGYVPVGIATPGSPPAGAPEWLEGRYFPRFPASNHLLVIPVRTDLDDRALAWSPDFRIDDSYETMMALTLAGMQGLINRGGPRVYLEWLDQDGVSSYWLPVLADQIAVIRLDLDPLSAVNYLQRRYGLAFHGSVVYDPQVPNTINLATMIAGLEDRVMLAPDQFGMPGMPSFAPITDLRSLVQNQGWDASEESQYRIYAWAYENLWPRLDHRIIGVISPGPPNSGATDDTGAYYFPLSLSERDYLVALRLPALYLDPADEPQSTLLDTFLSQAPSPIPVTGAFRMQEEGTVALAARHGDWVAAISWPGAALTCGNYTVWSGVRPEVVRYSAALDRERLLATLGNRPVVTLWSSDGDNLNYQMSRGFHGGVNFVWDNLKGLRFGWTTNPTLAELAPVVWNTYQATAGGASFVNGLSGAGYTYPDLMNDDQLDAYLSTTARYLQSTGLRTIQVDTRFSDVDERMMRAYYDHLAPQGLLGLLGGCSSAAGALPACYLGRPAPVVPPATVLRPGKGDQIRRALLAAKPEEITWDLQPDDSVHQGQVVADATASGGQAVLFTRSLLPNCCMVIATSRMTLAPGHYTATYRLKAPDNAAADSFAKLIILQQVGPGVALASRNIAPVEFQQAGQYQDFSLSLTLERSASDVQIWMDYYGGAPGYPATDLLADTVTLRREGGAAFPVFAAVWIGLVGPVEPMDEDVRILTEDFERDGGVVLHPDEFLAALNPEFMIDFAEPILGAGHPALTQARVYLAEGAYLDSLYTVREALKTASPR